MSYDIFLAFQKVPPSFLPLTGASDTPCCPLLCQPFLVIHEIYTREVRTRSFDLIITFFHHAFFDISETCGPRLSVELFSCATQRLMSSPNASVHCAAEYKILQQKKRMQGCHILLTCRIVRAGELQVLHQFTKWPHYSAAMMSNTFCMSKYGEWRGNSCTSGQSGGRRLLWDFWEAASIQACALTLLLLSGGWSWSLHAALQFLLQPRDAAETLMLGQISMLGLKRHFTFQAAAYLSEKWELSVI